MIEVNVFTVGRNPRPRISSEAEGMLEVARTMNR